MMGSGDIFGVPAANPRRYAGVGWHLDIREDLSGCPCIYTRLDARPKLATDVAITVYDDRPTLRYVSATIDGLRCYLGAAVEIDVESL